MESDVFVQFWTKKKQTYADKVTCAAETVMRLYTVNGKVVDAEKAVVHEGKKSGVADFAKITRWEAINHSCTRNLELLLRSKRRFIGTYSGAG